MFAFLVRDVHKWILLGVLAAAVSCSARAAAQVPGPNAPPGAGAATAGLVGSESNTANEPAEPPGYREAIENAIGEYEAGDFPEARALFEAAHNVFPNARSLRGMGMTEFELRNYPASIYFLEQALAAPVKPLTNELRTQTEALLTRARSFVGKLIVELQPADAAAALNGTRVQLPADHTLTLIAGDYQLKVSAPGYDDEQRALHVTATQVATIRVELPKHLEVMQPLAAGPIEKHESVLESPWLWTAIGVVVAGAVVGLGFGLSTSAPAPVKPSGGSSGVVLDGPR